MSGETILVIDMGGTGIKVGYLDDGRPAEFRRVFPTEALRSTDPVRGLGDMIAGAIAESGLQPDCVVATVPGFIDLDFDHVLSVANIPGLDRRPLASELGAQIGCPVFLERDAILLLSGEVTAGCARGKEDVVGLFFGTGVGAAYLHRGTPFRGAGWALELGLMPFRGDGRTLPGLPTDCLECYCSGRVLQEIAARYDVPVGGLFTAAADRQDLGEELATFIRYQAFAVGCAVAMTSSRTIVLGGGILEMDGFPRDELVRLVGQHSRIAETGRQMDLRWAELGWIAALHGAPQVIAEHRSRAGKI